MAKAHSVGYPSMSGGQVASSGGGYPGLGMGGTQNSLSGGNLGFPSLGSGATGGYPATQSTGYGMPQA